jgi:glycosyltransferase involved in cell wall biosynthesis
MKVLHLNFSDTEGGAARGAYWQHKALLKAGVQSNMLVANKKSDDFMVIGPQTRIEKGINLLRPVLDTLPLVFYPKRDTYIFSPAWLPNTVKRQVDRINPDIVNLHWICGGYFRPESFRRFKRIIVWTLRDMWAFTGGCHYANECKRYEDSCGFCPQLHSKKENDLSKKLWGRKFRAWKDVDMTIVAISHWLAECARSSSLFKNRRIEVIHNGLDEKLFKPMPKKVVREILGLPLNKKIILFGALNALTDKKKGFEHLRLALEKLVSSGRGDSTELVVLGSSEPKDAPNYGMNVRYMGRLHDDISLATAYAGADVTVVPSTQEAFGKTAIESQACGTPVVCFDTTGLKDIVEHKKNGYRARCFDCNDLTNGIAWVLQDEKRWQALSKRAREKVEQEFTLEVQAKKYIALYEELLCVRS